MVDKDRTAEPIGPHHLGKQGNACRCPGWPWFQLSCALEWSTVIAVTGYVAGNTPRGGFTGGFQDPGSKSHVRKLS